MTCSFTPDVLWGFGLYVIVKSVLSLVYLESEAEDEGELLPL